MPTTNAPWVLRQNEIREGLFHRVSAFPMSPKPGQFCYREDLGMGFVYSGLESTWVEMDGRTARPEGTAGGQLSGTYPNPSIAAGTIVDANVSNTAAIKLSKLAVDVLARANHTGSQLASTISDFDQQVRTNRLDQLAVPQTTININGQRLSGLADPLNPQDAATKAYVDGVAQGLDVKQSVLAATTGPITLSGTQTVDGVNLPAGARVLVKDQTNSALNGLYSVATGAWTRAGDADSSAKLNPGMFVFVEQGLVNADNGFVLTTDGAVTLGTTSLNFAQFSGAGQIDAGNGLTKSGNRLDVGGTPGRIVANADTLDIDSAYVGQSSITTVGTVSSGTWSATPVALAKGGTGATTAPGARLALLAAGAQAFAVPAATSGQAVINHPFNTQDVLVWVYNTATGGDETFDVLRVNADSVTINSSQAIPGNTYRAIIMAVPVATATA